MKGEPTIQDFMTQQPQSIGFGESLEKARDMMSKYGIRHLPVTKDGNLVGILSERELNIACGIESIDPEHLLVVDVCSDNPYVVTPDTPLWQVARVMAEVGGGKGQEIAVGASKQRPGLARTRRRRVDDARALSFHARADPKKDSASDAPKDPMRTNRILHLRLLLHSQKAPNPDWEAPAKWHGNTAV